MKYTSLFITITLIIIIWVFSLYAEEVVTPNNEPVSINLEEIKKNIISKEKEPEKKDIISKDVKNKTVDNKKNTEASKSKKSDKKVKNNSKSRKSESSKSVSGTILKKDDTGKKRKSNSKKDEKKIDKSDSKSVKPDIKNKKADRNKDNAKSKADNVKKDKKTKIAETDSKIKKGDLNKKQSSDSVKKTENSSDKIDILTGKSGSKSEKKDTKLIDKTDGVADTKKAGSEKNDIKKDISDDKSLKKNETIASLKDTIIINPLISENVNNRIQLISYNDIIKFSKSKKLQVIPDAGPVIDNIAFYLPAYSASFKIDGYDRELNYRLAVDLVRFKGGLQPVNSLLKIWGKDVSGRMFLIAELNEKNLAEEKFFQTMVPYELSYPGSFDIIVKEYSDLPGRWGIWDIIFTARKVELIDTVKPDTSEKIRETELKIFK